MSKLIKGKAKQVKSIYIKKQLKETAGEISSKPDDAIQKYG